MKMKKLDLREARLVSQDKTYERPIANRLTETHTPLVFSFPRLRQEVSQTHDSVDRIKVSTSRARDEKMG